MTIFAIALFSTNPDTVSRAGAAWNLLWVSLGNIVSGAGIVGLGYWAASRETAASPAQITLAAAE